MKFATEKKRQLTINLTPMIDIVFLLLIFFMITTTFDTTGGISVNLPKGTQSAQTAPRALEITVTADGTYHRDGQAVTLETLNAEIRRQTFPSLVIMADERVTHGKVVALMDVARTGGIEKISIATVVEAPGQ
ncbi:ExbD/TolR family protein [Chrysiogenes arsenatis]|uniref:ExbD/TolR family protein n=1 Tax=Chrysiogenes arsenatis TaxID=309797 RepID=UPI0003F6B343|nr:biopolymer transporter ExbD [Chrysiogenes arsenatis]